MWPVCRRSSSELWISVRTMLKDAAMLSWLGLVKQVLPSRDSCWLASANGAVTCSSPGEGRMVLQTIVLPKICNSSISRASRGSPPQQQQSSSRTKQKQSSYKVWQPAAASAALSRSGAATKWGSLQQQQPHSSG